MPSTLPVRRVPLAREAPTILGPDGRPITEAQLERSTDRPFQPQDPIPATEARGISPRGRQVRPGQNASYMPREGWRSSTGERLTPFQTLRTVGEFDLVRLAIEDVKGQILGSDWEVQPKKEWKHHTDSKKWLAVARAFTEMPDPLAARDFNTCVSMWLDELLVTDALSLFPHRTIRSQRFPEGMPLGLEQIDGATITPMVDERGRPPRPPHAAYQQIIFGRPETEFELDQLWYCPFNPRVEAPYGRSPTENVIVHVNIAIRKAIYDLTYYTHGTTPDHFLVLPPEWGPDEIQRAQDIWDEVMEGNDELRSGGVRMVPGGQYVATKTQTWDYQFMEWLGRVVAWAFGVSPLPIAKMTNRSVAETQELSSAESGIRPRFKFIKRIFDRYYHRELGLPGVEFVWGGDEVEDAAVVANRNVTYVAAGILSRDEVREELGKDPWKGETGDRPTVDTGAGPVLLDRALTAPLPGEMIPGGGGGQGAGFVAKTARPGPIPVGSGDIERDLTTWRRAALERHRKARKHRAFSSTAIPNLMNAQIQQKLANATTAQAIGMVFDQALQRVKKNGLSRTSPANGDRSGESRGS